MLYSSSSIVYANKTVVSCFMWLKEKPPIGFSNEKIGFFFLVNQVSLTVTVWHTLINVDMLMIEHKLKWELQIHVQTSDNLIRSVLLPIT